MDFFALLLPVLLIIGMFAGLVILKRRLFGDEPDHAPIPIPDIGAARAESGAAPAKRPTAATARAPEPAVSPRPEPAASPGPAGRPETTAAVAGAASDDISLTPARLYPCRLLQSEHKAIFSRLLKALPGYVVLPRIAYDQFLEARDGTPSENTSLQNRAGRQLADFVVCDRKLNVLLVCQIEDGSQLPARIEEREKMLRKAGLRLLRWHTDRPPDPAKLLNTVQTLEKLKTGAANQYPVP